MILSNDDLKGCLYWWTPGSGKSVMVALLIELLKFDRKKVVVASTPQNIRENAATNASNLSSYSHPGMARAPIIRM
jgi:hypothetical protein